MNKSMTTFYMLTENEISALSEKLTSKKTASPLIDERTEDMLEISSLQSKNSTLEHMLKKEERAHRNTLEYFFRRQEFCERRAERVFRYGQVAAGDDFYAFLSGDGRLSVMTAEKLDVIENVREIFCSSGTLMWVLEDERNVLYVMRNGSALKERFTATLASEAEPPAIKSAVASYDGEIAILFANGKVSVINKSGGYSSPALNGYIHSIAGKNSNGKWAVINEKGSMGLIGSSFSKEFRVLDYSITKSYAAGILPDRKLTSSTKGQDRSDFFSLEQISVCDKYTLGLRADGKVVYTPNNSEGNNRTQFIKHKLTLVKNAVDISANNNYALILTRQGFFYYIGNLPFKPPAKYKRLFVQL